MSFVVLSMAANLISLIFNFSNSYPVYTPVLVLLPVAGWISDSLLGRYRAITAGSFLLAVAYLFILISFVMLQFDWTIPAYVIMFISLMAAGFGGGTFFISSMPFVIDQMIGASADDIIAAIQWYCWAFAINVLLQGKVDSLQLVLKTICTLSTTMLYMPYH